MNEPTQNAPASDLLRWDDAPDLLSPSDLRRLLQVKSNRTLKKLMLGNQLPNPAIKIGNILRWRKSDVLKLLEANVNRPNYPA